MLSTRTTLLMTSRVDVAVGHITISWPHVRRRMLRLLLLWMLLLRLLLQRR